MVRTRKPGNWIKGFRAGAQRMRMYMYLPFRFPPERYKLCHWTCVRRLGRLFRLFVLRLVFLRFMKLVWVWCAYAWYVWCMYVSAAVLHLAFYFLFATAVLCYGIYLLFIFFPPRVTEIFSGMSLSFLDDVIRVNYSHLRIVHAQLVEVGRSYTYVDCKREI